MRGKNGPGHFTLTQMPRQQIGEIDEILAGLVGLGFRGRRSTSYLSRGSVFPSEYVPPSDSRVSPLAPLSALAVLRRRQNPANHAVDASDDCRPDGTPAVVAVSRLQGAHAELRIWMTHLIVGILNLALALV